MRRCTTSWSSGLIAAAAVVTSLLAPSTAGALPHCGSLDQPVCKEAPPPGQELELTPEENPHGLQPFTEEPSPDKLLWPRVRDHKPYGFNIASLDASLEEQAMLTEGMGGSLGRITVDWAWVQYHPNRDRGGIPWHYEAHVDAKYKSLVRRGIRPLLTILRTPRRFTKWAKTPRSSHVFLCGTSDACPGPPTAEHLDKLGTFAADLAKRYPLAAGIEVWNEPNLSVPNWGGDRPDPEHYAAMLDAAHDGVKSTRPAMAVLGGSLIPFATSSQDEKGYWRIALRMFLGRALLAGASPNMDAVSYHPYFGPYPTWVSGRIAEDNAIYSGMLAADNQIIRAYADTGTPMRDRVVASELGASTTDGYTEERQAAWLRLRFWAWDTNYVGFPLKVDAAIFHNPAEDLDPPFDQDSTRGLGWTYTPLPTADHRRFLPKEVFCTFRLEFGGFSDCPAWFSIYEEPPGDEPPVEEPPPGETAPTETTPGETTPGETTPGETTPGETTPTQTSPAETTPTG